MTTTAEATDREALRLSESVSLVEGAVQPDGTVLVHLIRPCIGRGRGRHLYEAEMLAKNAPVFTGWKSYVDHLSDQARKALGGLPRSIRDLGGRITESYWDPDVPADPNKGYGQGAVIGRLKPVPYVRELIEHDPELVEFSINGDATSVRPTTRDGQQVLLVEGIKPKGTVDAVTEAGAGGRVASLMEAMTVEEQEAALLESMTTDELREYMQEHRPDFMEALGADGDGGAGDGGAGGGDETMEITAEALREALATDEGRGVIAELVAEQTDDDAINERIDAAVKEAVESERDLIRAEAEGHAARQIELRDLRDEAHSLISEAKLPDVLAEQSRAKYEITESGPSAALDVLPELDDDGNVVKKAAEVLKEGVEAEITAQRGVAATLNPTKVRGQGPSAGGDGEGEGGDKPVPMSERMPLVSNLLTEAGFNDPDKVYEQA